jgi:hypothetical protein
MDCIELKTEQTPGTGVLLLNIEMKIFKLL